MLSRTAGCAHTVNPYFLLGKPAARPNRPFTAINRRASVTLQSTHEAALDVVDHADLKRRALELT